MSFFILLIDRVFVIFLLLIKKVGVEFILNMLVLCFFIVVIVLSNFWFVKYFLNDFCVNLICLEKLSSELYGLLENV